MLSVANAPAGRRQWFGLAILLLPCLLIAVDLTVLNLAMPTLSTELEPSATELLWIVDIYGFLVAGSLITMGAIGDRIGRRRLLLIGSAAFGIVSVLAAFATSAEALIAARALLGIAGATLMPSTVALIRCLFPDARQRSFAIGIWSASFAVGWAIGPLLGGVMIEHFWWGAVFLPALPVAVLVLVFGPRLLPESRSDVRGRIDLSSALLSLIAILAVVYGIKEIASGSRAAGPFVALAIGIALGFVFVHRQRRLPDPMIDLALFRHRGFSVALSATFLATAASVATMFFVAQYLQLVLDYSPFRAGLWSLPTAAASFVACLAAPIVARRFGTERICIAGLLLAMIAFAILAGIGADSPVRCVLATVLLTFGLGPVVTLATDLVISAAPEDQTARASACNETSFELGGAIGIALIGSASIAMYRREVADSLPDGLSGHEASIAGDTLSGALMIGQRLPVELGQPLIDVARDAYVQGLQTASLASLLIVSATAFVFAILMRQNQAVPARRSVAPHIEDPLHAEALMAD